MSIHEHEFGKDDCTYEKLDDGKVKCLTCAHECVIPKGGSGFCAVRQNIDGNLKLIVYSNANCANARDPIEKKPLNHVIPGSPTFSIATVGCNFACDFCQNWDLSQCTKDLKKKLQSKGHADMLDVEVGKLGYKLPPQTVVEKAVQSGCRIIAYTYNEPTIFFEYAIDTAKLAHEAGLVNVFKSNGYESERTVAAMKGLIDAVNIDLKSFRPEFYTKLCKSKVENVMATIRRLHEAGIWVEVTTLIIPGENDSDDELNAIAQFIGSVSADIPWHVTQFYPMYKMLDKPRTPVATVERAYEIGKRNGLKFVYGCTDEHSCTYCPKCGVLLISRVGRVFGAKVVKENFADGKCRKCGETIPGFWG